MLAWGCTVYDSGLLPDSDRQGDAGKSSGGTAGSSGASGASSGAAPSGAGVGTSQSGTFGSGGTDVIPTDGGQGGESSPAIGGAAGTSAGTGGAGTAGVGGNGGTAGGGTGGTGGSAPGVLCSEHPLSMKSTWIPTASSSSPGNGMESDPLYNPPSHMLDGLTGKRWSTGNPQGGSEWVQIDFGAIVNIKEITLQVFGMDTNDYPRSWAVRFTAAEDPKFLAPVLLSGVGAVGINTITLPTVATGRFLTIRQTGIADKWWTIAELLVTCTN